MMLFPLPAWRRAAVVLAALAAAVVTTTTATAQTGVTVFRGARIHPVSSPPIADGTIVVTGGRIAAVGGADVQIPSGATIVDLAGLVVTPGLVDASTTLGVPDIDLNEQGEEVTPQLRIADVLDPASRDFVAARRFGVTTVQVDPGNRNVIGGLGVVVKTVGDTLAQMLVKDESGLRLTMGAEPSSGNRAIRGGTPVGIYYRRPTTRMGVVWETRQAFYAAKAYLERKTDPDTPPELLGTDPGLEVLARALRGEVVVHTTARAEQDIRTALRLMDEFGYKALLEEATEAWRVVDELAEKGIPVLLAAPSRLAAADGAEVRYHTLNVLAQRGVSFAICSGAGDAPLPLIHEAMFAVRNGLAPAKALEAITLRPAEILAVADRVGSLQPGRDADLVVWTGDPLDPTTRVHAVYIGGREVTPR
ncbi:MAG: amidohydrolase family protein [Planctomycetes bacterium]|nr:amidohydrolase family protein [Planctomycetota bacterium]